ncbi:hypothetical protein [Pseudomonas eucalypticola]|uniref:Uncharacterized protein n=1 Tax=Pseudomonas eucalypticola TaxID=2599595 RepID=A0A7D5D8U7_9PSED|nr:hypothetical protein [Pseudomonas eucalypticola]QKZ05853.1 hypothetical protein HWQ56_19475 [Pseudomonas eucalypticola]
MTEQSELQGEIAALCCFMAAVASILPLSCQLRLWPAFEQRAEAMRKRLGPGVLRGFEEATVSLSSKRQGLG